MNKQSHEVPDQGVRNLERMRISQVGKCQRLASKIAVMAEMDRAAIIPIGEQLEEEQDVLYAIDAALRSASTNAVARLCMPIYLDGEMRQCDIFLEDKIASR